jgi:hypothetical protein
MCSTPDGDALACALQDGKTEYKSVTVAEDSTAEEFMDFYLDDDTRPKWVRTGLPSYSPRPAHLQLTSQAPAACSPYPSPNLQAVGRCMHEQQSLSLENIMGLECYACW